MVKPKKWIQKAINPAYKGRLHAKLGIPEGQKIPSGTLKAAAARGGEMGKEARLAMTLKKF